VLHCLIDPEAITPTTTLATAGVAYLGLTLPRIEGSTRWLAIP